MSDTKVVEHKWDGLDSLRDGKPSLTKRDYFPKVKEAREALKEKALEIYELQVTIIRAALDDGDYETAAKANQWLLEHLPSDAGVTVLDQSIDKPKEVQGYSGPSIQIGFQIGGLNPQALPAPANIIEAEPVERDPEQ